MKQSESVIIFDVATSGATLEDILKLEYGISGRLFRKLKKNNQVYLNGQVAKGNIIVSKGDKIALIMEDENENIIPKKIPLDIIYEDHDLLILNKQPNIVVHPTKSHIEDTIANGVAYYFKTCGIKKKVRFVNRLDMGTSGVLVIAKNSFAHQQLSKQMNESIIEKSYITVVEGVVMKDEYTIDLPIGKSEDESLIRTVVENGQRAITKFKVIERFNNASLLEVKLETGRTHQIRVHMKHIGHPIIGDTLYNRPHELINRQALHAYKLIFKQPRTNERKVIIAEIPKDINLLIEHLKA